jgi:drug/metabolite transporter (DMT)-like permease
MQGYRARTIGLALVAHTGFGLYVVLVKYLLRYLPPFGLLAVAFGIAVPVNLSNQRDAILNSS